MYGGRKILTHGGKMMGACGLAPVMMINEDVYGRITKDDVDGILAKYAD